MLRRAGIDTGGEATAALGTSTILQLSSTLALPIVALPAMLGGAAANHDLATAAYLGIPVLAALLVAAAAAFLFDEPLELAGRAVQWLLNQTVRRRVAYWLPLPVGGIAYAVRAAQRPAEGVVRPIPPLTAARAARTLPTPSPAASSVGDRHPVVH